jgi:pimeloyl-ACP methyl ester carboxylesterase
LNRWPQYLADIVGTDLLFIHARSHHLQAFLLVLTHGWPGTTREFHRVIEPLIAPERHGGEPCDAFHVICPALAGYGWSPPLPTFDCDVDVIAGRQAALIERLGYPRNGVQRGDWVSLVSSYTALRAPRAVAGVHLNMCPAPSTPDPAEARAQGVVPGRSAIIEAYAKRWKGHAVIQSLLPDQLASASNDSPLGLAARIVCNFYLWGDMQGGLRSRFDHDYLLTTTMIFWLTGSMPSAIRLHHASALSGRLGPPTARVEVPVGVALFKDLARLKRAWAEQVYNIQRWTEFTSGGRFAAVEEPAALVGDIRAFFRPYR